MARLGSRQRAAVTAISTLYSGAAAGRDASRISLPAMSTAPEPSAAIAPWLATGALDPELAALLWLLVEARVPAVVAGGAGATAPAPAMPWASFPAAGHDDRRLDGERGDFAWLPRPSSSARGGRRNSGARDARPAAGDDRARRRPPVTTAPTDWRRACPHHHPVVVGRVRDARATAGDSLEAVFAGPGGAPVGRLGDELARLGVVLIVDDDTGSDRVVAAHLPAPVARDAHRHVRRMPPADHRDLGRGGSDRFGHFTCGITAELADRIGVRPADLRSTSRPAVPRRSRRWGRRPRLATFDAPARGDTLAFRAVTPFPEPAVVRSTTDPASPPAPRPATLGELRASG